MAKLTQEEILAYLDEATILELNELVKAIEEKYGVSAAAPVAVAAAPAEAEEQGPTSVTVTMTSFGETKVKDFRAIFKVKYAPGALAAVRFLQNKDRGFYTERDLWEEVR